MVDIAGVADVWHWGEEYPTNTADLGGMKNSATGWGVDLRLGELKHFSNIYIY